MAYLELKDVTKQFGSVIANDHISLAVEKGEIRAILGENGAGKSTLMNIIYGLYDPDGGDVILDGQNINHITPRQALGLGIGMIHQEFMLVDAFTVLENIMIGLPTKSFFLEPSVVEKKVKELSVRYKLPINCSARISDLSVGEQQRVEILKTLYHDVSLLILDEPTAVLTPQEADALFEVLSFLVENGKTVILITHKLKEVMSIADKVSVLRGGKLVGTVDIQDTSAKDLAKMMVGREIVTTIRNETAIKDEVALEVRNLTIYNDHRTKVLNDISFKIHKGEIVGIAGVSGNGQLELANAIAGLIPATEGEIILNGKDVTKNSCFEMIRMGISYIPGDRINVGSISELTIESNMILKSFWKPPITQRGLIDPKAVVKRGNRLIEEYDIRTPSGKLLAKSLSGGNLQKVILAREMDLAPILLIADQPSRGLDIAAAQFMGQRLLEARNNDTGILLISEDLDELLNLSDRILVFYEGEIMKNMVNEKIALDEIGLLMAGVTN